MGIHIDGWIEILNTSGEWEGAVRIDWHFLFDMMRLISENHWDDKARLVFWGS